jgi:hypothetical protein
MTHPLPSIDTRSPPISPCVLNLIPEPLPLPLDYSFPPSSTPPPPKRRLVTSRRTPKRLHDRYTQPFKFPLHLWIIILDRGGLLPPKLQTIAENSAELFTDIASSHTFGMIQNVKTICVLGEVVPVLTDFIASTLITYWINNLNYRNVQLNDNVNFNMEHVIAKRYLNTCNFLFPHKNLCSTLLKQLLELPIFVKTLSSMIVVQASLASKDFKFFSWIFSFAKYDLNLSSTIVLEHVFKNASRFQTKDMLQWLYYAFPKLFENKNNVAYMFLMACQYVKTENVKWLYHKFNIIILLSESEIFGENKVVQVRLGNDQTPFTLLYSLWQSRYSNTKEWINLLFWFEKEVSIYFTFEQSIKIAKICAYLHMKDELFYVIQKYHFTSDQIINFDIHAAAIEGAKKYNKEFSSVEQSLAFTDAGKPILDVYVSLLHLVDPVLFEMLNKYCIYPKT